MILWILAILLICVGFLGCFINKIPGPLLAFIGILLPVLFGDVHADVWMLVLIGVLVVASMIVSSKFLPKIGAMVSPFGKAGSWGTTIGSLFGLIGIGVAGSMNPIVTLILSFIVLPYGFAFLFELISQKSAGAALKSAGGAYATFFVGTVLKLVVCYLSLRILFA